MIFVILDIIITEQIQAFRQNAEEKKKQSDLQEILRQQQIEQDLEFNNSRLENSGIKEIFETLVDGLNLEDEVCLFDDNYLYLQSKLVRMANLNPDHSVNVDYHFFTGGPCISPENGGSCLWLAVRFEETRRGIDKSQTIIEVVSQKQDPRICMFIKIPEYQDKQLYIDPTSATQESITKDIINFLLRVDEI